MTSLEFREHQIKSDRNVVIFRRRFLLQIFSDDLFSMLHDVSDFCARTRPDAICFQELSP